MSRPFAVARLALALLPLALIVACDVEEANDPGLLAARSCPGCNIGGYNSPTINSFEIPELHLGQEPNHADVTLIDIADPNGHEYSLSVVNEEFFVDTGNGLVIGAGLIGWKILLDSPGGKYELEIASYAIHDSLANEGPGISAYGLKYESHLVAGEILSVCPGSLPNEAVVTLIRGETYDRAQKTVQPAQLGWFTLACADEAVFKMKRMNYGPNAYFNNTGMPASVAQRQATLKMITADYCGNGNSYTVQGTPLIWIDAAHTVGPEKVQTPNQREAFWDENGALCLDTPRFAAKSDVKDECELPACSEIDPTSSIWGTITP